MKEIGSEFWNIPTRVERTKSPFPNNNSWYLSGRSALNAILDDLCNKHSIKTALLPSWCCDSMIKPFLSHGLKVEFYPVYLDNNILVQDINADKCDAVLVMDYFGFHNCPQITTSSIVIRDITHSMFCNQAYNADYVFGSLRKWTGFYTGGFAWSNNSNLSRQPVATNEYIALRKKAMQLKSDYIEKSIGDKSFLSLFSDAEEWLDNNEFVFGTAERDLNAFEHLDIPNVRKQRRENASYLISRLSDYSFIKGISDTDCPLFVPIFLKKEKRNSLRSYLIENKIYCPIHWGISEYHNLNNKTRHIYDEELSIICDQRYDIADMQYIADKIEEFLR